MKRYAIEYIKDANKTCDWVNAEFYIVGEQTTTFYDDQDWLVKEVFNSKVVAITLIQPIKN